jgi:phosphoribosylformylglycinamidine synthase
MLANELDLIESNHDISDGGLAVAVTESAFGGGFGADINLDELNDLDLNSALFSESHSRFVCSVKTENKKKFEEIFDENAKLLGKVTLNQNLVAKYKKEEVINIEINKLRTAWERGLK